MSISMKSLLESVINPNQTTASTQLDESFSRSLTNQDVASYIKVHELLNGGVSAPKVVDFKRHSKGIYFVWLDEDEGTYNINNIDRRGEMGQPVEYDIPDISFINSKANGLKYKVSFYE